MDGQEPDYIISISNNSMWPSHFFQFGTKYLAFFCSLSSLPIYKSAIKSSCGCEQIVAVLQIIQNSQTKKLSKDVCALSVKKNLLVEFKIFIVTKKTLNGTIWFQILLNTSYPSNVNVIFTLFEAAFIVISCKC